MPRLATFVQVSDLHMGMPLRPNGDAFASPDVVRLAMTYSLFQGSLGHQARSLRNLQQSLEDLHASGEAFELIVTGDHTRCGHGDELNLAHTYVVDEIDLHPPRRQTTGLRHSSVPIGGPGNHDHWGGYNSVFSTTSTEFHGSALATPPLPYVVDGPTVNGRTLVFIGVDSDAGVNPGSWERAWGQGDPRPHLSALMGTHGLGSRPANQLRVLVMHHAVHTTKRALRLTAAALRELQSFIHTCGIQVILSGHTHRLFNGIVAGAAHELCCGSTTQIDDPPKGWTSVGGGPPKTPFRRNSFLVHRLYDAGVSIRWEVQRVRRSRTGSGFVPVVGPPYAFLA